MRAGTISGYFISPLLAVLLSAAFATSGELAAAKHFFIPDHSTVITHASRWYHTGKTTIETTQSLIDLAVQGRHPVFALAQKDIQSDPLWYAGREKLTLSFISASGESPLYPFLNHRNENIELTALGGYHSACLGWTLSELIARFVQSHDSGRLILQLPMKAIYTGYLRDSHGELYPRSAEDEAGADSSIDGLNLYDATSPLSDLDWSVFMLESLRWALFKKAPIVGADLRNTAFELYRDGSLLKTFDERLQSPDSARRIVVELHYSH